MHCRSWESVDPLVPVAQSDQEFEDADGALVVPNEVAHDPWETGSHNRGARQAWVHGPLGHSESPYSFAEYIGSTSATERTEGGHAKIRPVRGADEGPVQRDH